MKKVRLRQQPQFRPAMRGDEIVQVRIGTSDDLHLPGVPARKLPRTELTFRHRLLAYLMVHGTIDCRILEFVNRTRRTKGENGKTKWEPAPPPAPNEPLGAAEAGRLIGLRKKLAESMTEHLIFRRQLRIERQRKAGGDGAAAPDDDIDNDDED